MRRFDKDSDNLLRYSEFCEAFIPIDNYHASTLAKRGPITSHNEAGGDLFCPSTMNLYRGVWQLHLRNEVLVQRMRCVNKIDAQAAFTEVDSDRDGIIDRNDVSAQLK